MTIQEQLADLVRQGAIVTLTNGAELPLWSAEMLPTEPPALFYICLGATDPTGMHFRAYTAAKKAGLGIEFTTLPGGEPMWIYAASDTPTVSTDAYMELRESYAAEVNDPEKKAGYQALFDGERETVIATVQPRG